MGPDVTWRRLMSSNFHQSFVLNTFNANIYFKYDISHELSLKIYSFICFYIILYHIPVNFVDFYENRKTWTYWLQTINLHCQFAAKIVAGQRPSMVTCVYNLVQYEYLELYS